MTMHAAHDRPAVKQIMDVDAAAAEIAGATGAAAGAEASTVHLHGMTGVNRTKSVQ